MKKVHACLILALLLSFVAPFAVKAEGVEPPVVASGSPVIFRDGRCWFMVFTPSTIEPEKYRWTLSYALTDNSNTVSSLLITPPNELSARVYKCSGRWDNSLANFVWDYYGSWLSEGKPAVFNHSNTVDDVVEQIVVLSGSETVVGFQATQYTFTVYPNGTYKFVGHFIRQ